VFGSDGIASSFVRGKEYVVLSGGIRPIFVMPISENRVLIKTENGNVVIGNTSFSLQNDVRACNFPNGTVYVFNGASVQEIFGGTVKSILPSGNTPGIAASYNDTSLVLASFSSIPNAYWISSPLGLDIGSVNKLSFDQMTGKYTSDLFSYEHYPPTFGIIPSSNSITAASQVGESIAFFTKEFAYIGTFRNGLLIFEKVNIPLPVSHFTQVFAGPDMCYVLTDNHVLYAMASGKPEPLFDFSILPPDKQRPSKILGSVAGTVLLDNYLFMNGNVTGPMDPHPIGFYSTDGAFAFNSNPVDSEGNVPFYIETDWILSGSQGLTTLNTVAFDAIYTEAVKVAVDYVTDRESRRSAIISSSAINVKPDSPAIIRRVGSNFRFKYSGKINNDHGRIDGGIARIQLSDLRYIRGPFGQSGSRQEG